MPYPEEFGLDAERCRRRNRLAAMRYSVNTAQFSKAREVPQGYGKLDFARGILPKTPEQALERINALLPEGSAKLTLNDVHLLPLMEAANNRFIGDRYMFLGSSTLRNIQRDAEAGFAFMNSHRRGSVSTPGEQPYGRTYSARYERFTSDDPTKPSYERVQLGVYMLRGIKPNGSAGPSTDDLAASIQGATSFDVSMGINGGTNMCDVCGFELKSEKCTHVPGTSRDVTTEQSHVQKRRGVNRGHASYTLDDGHGGEISSVYDGAIPGAGFSKAMEYAQQSALSTIERREAALSYRTLLAEGDFGMDINSEEFEEVAESFADRIVRKLGLKRNSSNLAFEPVWSADDNERYRPAASEVLTTLESATHTLSVTSAEAAQASTELQIRLNELERQNTEYKREFEARQKREYETLASQAANEALNDKHLLPAGVPAMTALATFLAPFETGTLLEYTDALGATKRSGPLSLLSSVMRDVPQHGLLSDHEFTDLPKDAMLLSGAVIDNDEVLMTEAMEDVEAVTRNNGHNGNGRNGNGHIKNGK